MVADSTFGSPNFRRVAEGLVALQQLESAGRDDSPEGDKIRDSLDAPLRALSKIERERAQWLSEDLYSVSEAPKGANQNGIDPHAQRRFEEAREARQARDWDRALSNLRQSRECVTPDGLSFLRGRIWSDAGYPKVAAMFFGHASKLAPDNAGYKTRYMSVLEITDPVGAGKLAKEVLSDYESQHPTVVAYAASIRVQEAQTASDADGARIYQDLIPILEDNLNRLDDIQHETGHGAAFVTTVSQLAICHRSLGHRDEAVEYFTLGIREDRNDDTFFIARGILQYGKSGEAIADFQQAIALGASVIWPYLFLAHHYLITSEFGKCRLMCEKGVLTDGSDAAKSQLWEWKAIVESVLGYGVDVVAKSFEEAIRLDPGNVSAKRNKNAFETSLKVSEANRETTWEWPSEEDLKQFERADQRHNLVA